MTDISFSQPEENCNIKVGLTSYTPGDVFTVEKGKTVTTSAKVNNSSSTSQKATVNVYNWKDNELIAQGSKYISARDADTVKFDFQFTTIGKYDVELILYDAGGNIQDYSGRFTATVTTPAEEGEFTLSDLSLDPQTPKRGESFSVSVYVDSSYDSAKDATVYLEGTATPTPSISKTVSVPAGGSETVSWDNQIFDSTGSNTVNVSVSDKIISRTIDVEEGSDSWWGEWLLDKIAEGKQAFFGFLDLSGGIIINLWDDITNWLWNNSSDQLHTMYLWLLEEGTSYAQFFKGILNIYMQDWSTGLNNAIELGQSSFNDFMNTTYIHTAVSDWRSVAEGWPDSIPNVLNALNWMLGINPLICLHAGTEMLEQVMGEDWSNWKQVLRDAFEWYAENADLTPEEARQEIETIQSELESVLSGNRKSTLSPFVITSAASQGIITLVIIVAEFLGYQLILSFINEEMLQGMALQTFVPISNDNWEVAKDANEKFQWFIHTYFVGLGVLIFATIGGITVAPAKFAGKLTRTLNRREIQALTRQFDDSVVKIRNADDYIGEAYAAAKANNKRIAEQKALEASSEMADARVGISNVAPGTYSYRVEALMYEGEACSYRLEQAIRNKGADIDRMIKLDAERATARGLADVSRKQKVLSAVLGSAIAAFPAYFFYMYGKSAQVQHDTYATMINDKLNNRSIDPNMYIEWKPPGKKVPTGVLLLSSVPNEMYVSIWQDGEWKKTGMMTPQGFVLPTGSNKIKLYGTGYPGGEAERGKHSLERIFTINIENNETHEITQSMRLAEIPEEITVQVQQVVSGHTFRGLVEGSGVTRTFRLAGIDCNKLFHNSFYCSNCLGAKSLPADAWYPESKSKLANLIEGVTLNLKVDNNNQSIREFSSSKQEVVNKILVTAHTQDNRNVIIEMLKTGLACCNYKEGYTTKHIDKNAFNEAENKARSDNKGFWAEFECGVLVTINPPEGTSPNIFIDGNKII